MTNKQWVLPSGSHRIAGFVLLMAMPAWGAEQIYILQEQAAASPAEYSFQSTGTVNGARMLALPETGGHVVALTEQGRVWAWGNNSQGQLATGGTEARDGWTEVEGLTDIIGIAAGTLHSVALKQDGTVWTWGANDQGQLGGPSLVVRPRAGIVSGLGDVSMVAAGGAFTLALRGDGTVWAFGSNWSEIVPGDGRRLISEPVPVAGLADIEVLAVRGNRGYARDQQGRIWVWGKSDEAGSISAPQVLTDAPPSLLAELELRFSQSDRTTLQMQWRGNRQRSRLASVAGSTLDIADGNKEFSYRYDGSVVDIDWGWAIALITSSDSVSGLAGHQVGGRSYFNTPEHGRPIIKSPAMRFSPSLATVTGNGNNNPSSFPVATVPGPPPLSANDPPALSLERRFSAGGTHALAIRDTDGSLWGWGRNEYGELGDGTTITRTAPVLTAAPTSMVAVSTSAFHTLALPSDGTVWSWGYNGYGELGSGSTNNRSTPQPISDFSGVLAIAAGTFHSLALKSDGTVWAWGLNGNGQLGDGTTLSKLTPVQTVGLTGIVAIAAGAYSSYAVKNDGTVWSWGRNGFGQLGDGTITDRQDPVQVQVLTGAVAIAAGAFFAAALKTDGTVWAWGYNADGELGDGSTTDSTTIVRVSNLVNVVGIAAGDFHTLAVKSDGTVWAWGNNVDGELGDGTFTNRTTPVSALVVSGAALAVAAGSNFSMAFLNDGTSLAWGDNGFTQFTVATPSFSPVPVGATWITFVKAIPGDFNQDSVTDVIWQDPTIGQAQIFYLGGSQSVTVTGAANVTATNTWRIAGVADFNGDGRPDLVWQDPVSGASQVWFLGGPGGNQLIGSVTLGGPNSWRIAAVGDFNRDGHPDIIWQDQTSGFAQIWFLGGNNGTTFLGAVNLTASNTWRIVGVGDFNKDGHPDVVWQDPVRGATQIWYLGGAQGNTLIGATNVTVNNSWRVAAVADFNQDGFPDLIYQDQTTGASQAWFLNNATVVGTAAFSGPNPWRIVGPK